MQSIIMYFAHPPIKRLLQYQMHWQSEFCHPLHMQVAHYMPANGVCKVRVPVFNSVYVTLHSRLCTCTIVACMSQPALH